MAVAGQKAKDSSEKRLHAAPIAMGGVTLTMKVLYQLS